MKSKKLQMKVKRMLTFLTAATLILTSVLAPGVTVLASSKNGDLPDFAPAGKTLRNVMYYGDWSIWGGQGNFYPGGIPADQLTHLNFAFLDFDGNGNLVFTDKDAAVGAPVGMDGVQWGAENAGILSALQDLRAANPNLRIGVSIGGWSKSGDFTAVAKNAATRAKFVENVMKFIKYTNMDFVDIDWEYPCIRVGGIDGDSRDKENFTLLMKEFRLVLDQKKDRSYFLSIAAGGDEYFTLCTQMDQVQQYLDYVQLMTYDLKGGFTILTGHHAGLYSNQVDLFPSSADRAVQCFVQAGVPIEKLVLGAAFYSREWKEVPDIDHGFNQMAQTVGNYGPPYHTLVNDYINKNGYIKYWDEEAMAPYLYNGETFISYDDKESLACKADYVRSKNLYGIMYWEYGCDETHTLTGWLRKKLDS